MSVLDLFSPEAIDERAKQMDPGATARKFGRFLVAVLVFVFAGLGWLAGAAIFSATWIAAAVAEGYTVGRRKQARTE